jgi:hypothetical protein
MPPQPRRRAPAKKAAKKAAAKKTVDKKAGASKAAAKKTVGKVAAEKAAAKKTVPKKSRVPRALRFVADPHDLHAVVDNLGGLVTAPARAAGFGDLTPPVGQAASQAFRLLRPLDLVVLDVLGYDLELQSDGGPTLVPTSATARLEVRLSFQHVNEHAEPEMQVPPPLQPPPVQALAANSSRLVYAVAADERIPFSSAGVLAAMSRLPLVLVPLATPRPPPIHFTPTHLGPFDTVVSTLPQGIQLVRTEEGLVVAAARSRSPRVRRKASGVAVGDVLASATAVRIARNVLATEAAVDLRRVRPSVSGLSDLLPRLPGPLRPRVRQQPRAPLPGETAIEAPHRLIISPSSLGGFTHATEPQAAPSDPGRVELWHSRLGVRTLDKDDKLVIDERASRQRIVRAVWTRDLDDPPPDVVTFLASLDESDREALVRQSADPRIATPQPVDADRLYLSSLGAYLDLHGVWDTKPYDTAGFSSRLAWDHEAPMGRDQFVRIVKPYYFFCLGISTALVKITERKIKESADPQARLYQQQFFATSNPTRAFQDRRMPFRQVTLRPSVTPSLDLTPNEPGPPIVAGSIGAHGADLFWPTVGGVKFHFLLDCLDWDGRRKFFPVPLLAVAAQLGSPADKADIVTAYTSEPEAFFPAAGQAIAYAESTKPGETAMESVTLRFTGEPGNKGDRTSTPSLINADVIIPAMRHLSPEAGPVTVAYAKPYLDNGFAGANTDTQVFLTLPTPGKIVFSQGTASSGGFVRPDLPIRGLSRALGAVGRDVDDLVAAAPDQKFDPDKFIKGVLAELPKLFGLFELTDILAAVGLGGAPKLVTESLDQIAGLLADLDQLRHAVDDGIARLTDQAANAATSALQAQANAAKARLDTVAATIGAHVDELVAAVDTLMALDTDSDLPAVTAAVTAPMNALQGLVDEVVTIAREESLPPVVKAPLERLGGALQPLLAAGKIVETIGAIASFVNGLDPTGLSVRARYEWRPTMTNFPFDAGHPSGPSDSALFFVRSDGFVLSIEARASGQDGVSIDAMAALSDFGLNLFPGAPLIRLTFDRLAFRAASGRKAEVDVVFQGIEFVGVLSFIETLKQLIPFDGFSDPPYVDVSSDGVKAGFDLALPNVAVGVFSLENIALGADVRVPFLGEAVTVGFYFCTREKPFRLTVMMIGGGGFVGIRLSPKGLVLLEMSLEAGASLSVDLGVASGSVSIMVGVYLKLEADKGQLTGYFRIRGEVDVLHLISASITLELSLTYEFDTGKMVGRASIEIEVEVFFFSFSVSVSCERRLAGSNGDPTFAEILGVTTTGDSPAWDDYCAAFAGA